MTRGHVGGLLGKPLSSGMAARGHPLHHPALLLQPHLHSYKEAFEEMEGASPTSPPPSGGKISPPSLSPLGPLEPPSQPGPE